MLFCRKYATLAVIAIAALFTGACKADISPVEECAKGRIVLPPGAICPVSCQSKAAVNFTDEQISEMTFYLNGTTSSGVTITNKVVTFNEGYFSVEEGNYTLQAIYSPESCNTGEGSRCYEGTSSAFSITAGQETAVSIEMTVSNAKVNIVFDASFRLFYSSFSVNFTSPRNYSVSENASVYFQASTVEYSISATGRDNSSAAGKTVNITGGSISLSPAQSHTLTIKANPEGNIIFDDPCPESASWNGEFS